MYRAQPRRMVLTGALRCTCAMLSEAWRRKQWKESTMRRPRNNVSDLDRSFVSGKDAYDDFRNNTLASVYWTLMDRHNMQILPTRTDPSIVYRLPRAAQEDRKTGNTRFIIWLPAFLTKQVGNHGATLKVRTVRTTAGSHEAKGKKLLGRNRMASEM